MSNQHDRPHGESRPNSAPAVRFPDDDPLAELARLVGQDDPFESLFRDPPRKESDPPRKESSAPSETRKRPHGEPPAREPEMPPLDMASLGASLGLPRASHRPAATPDAGEAPHPAVGFEESGYDAPSHGMVGGHGAAGNDGATGRHGLAGGHGEAAHAAVDQDPGSDPSWETEARATDRNREPAYERPNRLQPAPLAAAPHPSRPPADRRAPAAHAAAGRRKGLAIAAALVGVAVLGGGAAVAYRGMAGSARGTPPLIKAEPGPSKVTPNEGGETVAESQPEVDGKELRTGQERVVPREEKVAALPAAGKPPTRISLPGPEQQGEEFEPRRVRTLIVRPDGTVVREDAAPPATGATPAEPVRAAPAPKPADAQVPAPSRPAASPQPVEPATQPAPAISDAKPAEPAPSNRTKVAALRRDAATSRDDEAPAASAPWSVQLTSQKSESQARSALADIQKKHQALLSRHKPRIVKVELGSKGTYYRVQVGTASQEAANKLCSGLKAAGASCLVHRN